MKSIILFFIAVICSASSENSTGAVDLSFSCVKPENIQEYLPPILLLHGLLGDRHNWKGVYEVLAMQTNRMVCASDARNHGLSPRTEAFSFDLMAEDTIRLLNKHNVHKVILLGQSMGGKTAVVTALKHPERVEKLLVEDMRPNGIAPEASFLLNFTLTTLKNSLDAVPEGANEEQAKEAVMKFISDEYKKISWELDEYTKNVVNLILVCNISKCHFTMDIDFGLRVINNPDLRKVHGGLYEGETLFIYGKRSPFKVDEVEDEIMELFPNAKLIGIEGAGHSVHYDKPMEFLSAVVQFINGNAAQNEIQSE